jgi:predicted ATP-grasp superfamily ATP-dependent carboligase
MRRKDVFESAQPVGVVFNCHINGLGITRSLGEKGIPVLALDCSRWAIGLYSRYCYHKICPDPAKSQREFVDFLLQTGKTLKSKGVLFPTNDKWLIAISRYREELEPYYLFPMSGDEVIQKCMDKIQMYTIAEQAGIPIPRTIFCEDMARLPELRTAIEYPCVIKARIPPDFDSAFGKRVFRAEGWDDIADWLNRNDTVIKEGRLGCVIQEVIPGDATALYTFSAYSNRRAEVVAFSVIRKMKQSPPDFGTIVIGKVERQPRVIDLGMRLLQRLSFHGLSNTEFKFDPRDGSFKLMEVNARSGMSIYYTTCSGVNLPYFAYQEAIGKEIKLTSPLEGEYGAIWVVPEFRWLTLPARKIGTWLNPGKLTAGDDRRTLSDTPKTKVINSVFQKQDPAPYLMLLLNTLVGLVRGGWRLLCARFVKYSSQ